jgi:hypothetical protein
MAIQDLGALGELIGAVAVLATLIYLAIQTRQARIAAEQTLKFAELQASRAVMAGYSQSRSLLLSDPRISDAIAKVNAGEILSDAERIQLAVVFEDLFIASAFSYLSSRASGAVHSSEADIDYIVLLLRENPGLISEWRRVENIVRKMSAEYVTSVNLQLETNNGTVNQLESDA